MTIIQTFSDEKKRNLSKKEKKAKTITEKKENEFS